MKLPDLNNLDEVEDYLRGLPQSKLREIERQVAPVTKRVWLPQPGPQTTAYYSEADETLYGGAAGGGKSDLIAGLCTTAHTRSLVFRMQSEDLDALWDRIAEVASPIMGTNNTVKKTIKTTDGRLIEGGHLGKPGSEKAWQGRAHDLIAFDEAAQLDELRVEFVMKWLRSTTPGQRQRVIFATNPPIPEIKGGELVDTGVGDWLLRWFAPWVDDAFPNPAADGELRWCFMQRDGDRLTTVWVDGPGCYNPTTHEKVLHNDPAHRQRDIDNGVVMVAKSRTFIRSLLKDNIFLRGSGYAERMASTPEPLKSMLLLGDFTVKGEDHPMQVIPTQWVLEAQKRWHDQQMDPDLHKQIMLVLFGDVAQGGADTFVLAPLYVGDYFGELVTQPGHKTPDGIAAAQLILATRRNNALIGLDGTGGWAGDTYRTLQLAHNIEAELVVSSVQEGCGWDAANTFQHGNVRTEMWWGFREALDPKGIYQIALPPSARLRAELTSPHWYVRGKRRFIESKDDLKVRLTRSTDEADAVIGAWYLREMAIVNNSMVRPDVDIVDRLNGRYPGGARDKSDPDNYDPLEDW